MPTRSLSRAEQETHISRCADEDHWTIYCTDPAELPYYLGLAKRVGGKVFQHQGGTKIQLPEDAVSLQMRRKLNLRPEQRAERAEQMQARRTARTGRKATLSPHP